MKLTLRAAVAASMALAVASGATISCKPDFGVRESLVDREEVIAVRTDPPEAKPGDAVTFSVLVAAPSGTVAAPPTAWAWCATPKLLTDNGAVSAACAKDGVVPVGVTGGAVAAAIPESACFDFGPETRSADQRPRDPDVTGGYFQPIRATVGGDVVAFGFARIACNLANTSGDLAADFRARYVPNKNPTLAPLGAPAEAARGSRIMIRTSWAPEDAETYLVLDAAAQALVTRRESMRVSWYATAGSFEHDRTGRTEEDPESFTEDAWTAPDAPGPVHLWAVLRDARGGVAFASANVDVR
jgi:hypothetical protein